jgi:hypothetical protein
MGVEPPVSSPCVSVIMAVYNGAGDLPHSVPTVLAQDFADFELVVVDDASTDATADVIHGFADPRIVYHRNPSNRGQTASLNVGLRLARGEFVARIDADDRFLPGKLSRQVRYLEAHPEVAVVGTSARRVDIEGRVIGPFFPPQRPADIAFHLLHSSPICHVSALMRRDALLAVGGYDEAYRYAADFKLWSDLHARGYGLANLPDMLTEYRVDAGTFGGSNLLGGAGDESAQIIRVNAARLTGTALTLDEARAIHLRATPSPEPGVWERALAYVQLRELAVRMYRRVPARTAAQLFLGAVWSIARAQPPGAGAARSTIRRRVRGDGAAILAMAIARTVRLLGLGRLARLRQRVGGTLVRWHA